MITEKSETFYLDKPEKFRSLEIVLRDKASLETDEQKPLTYAKGTRQFFTVEVLPDWGQPADSVRRIATPEGLRGLEVRADGRWLLLVHNPTDAAVTLQTALPWAEGPLSLHTSGSHAPAPSRSTRPTAKSNSKSPPTGTSSWRRPLRNPGHDCFRKEAMPLSRLPRMFPWITMITVLATAPCSAENWPGFRGPTGQGISTRRTCR